ncbi:MAG TPA: four helix bundle protein [Candidatus Angelobacter sp.]|nr:four helix bundle protein [Candidatus Angelobacter sp.]
MFGCATGKSYQDLFAWQKAMDLVTEIYRLSRCFPKEELYGLTSQLRRAAVSVPSNIAEGQGRHGKVEFRHFLRLAMGSLMEIETQVLIADRLNYVESDLAKTVLRDSVELGRILSGLIASLD